MGSQSSRLQDELVDRLLFKTNNKPFPTYLWLSDPALGRRLNMPPFGVGLRPPLLSLRPTLTRWGPPLPSGGRRTGFPGTPTPAPEGPQRHQHAWPVLPGCAVRGLCCFSKAGHALLTAQRFPGAGPFPRESAEGPERSVEGGAARASPSAASGTGRLCLRAGTSGAARAPFPLGCFPAEL